MPNQVEPTPDKQTAVNQQGQAVPGSQTNIIGDVNGPVLSGTFHAPVHVGDVHNVIYTHARPTPVTPEQLAAAQQLLNSLPLDSLPDLGALPPGSRMVFARNPLFTGRAPELQQLARALKGEHTIAAISQVAAATGLGGIGKTQLAVEFAHRYGRYFAGGVFWVSLASADDVKNQIAQCGGAAGLQLRADYDALKLDEQVALVLSEWQSPLPRLLIFDNCESEELLQQWRPPSGGARILVTSRNAEWDLTLGIQSFALGVLTHAESVELLCKFRPDLQGLQDLQDLEGLNAIAEELGDLPLALHLAGSYLRRYKVSAAELLADLRRPDLLTHPSLTGLAVKIKMPTGYGKDHENHVARTFALSYLCLNPEDETDALALKALARAACFAPGIPIPRWLLKKTLGEVQPELLAEESLHRLAELGLLAPGDDGMVALHRLLANFVQRTRPDSKALDTVIAITRKVAALANDTETPTLLRPWIHHLRHIAGQALLQENDLSADLFKELGYHLNIESAHTEARIAYEQALQIDETILGSSHPEIATDINNLGMTFYYAGDYAKARVAYERALQIATTASTADKSNLAIYSSNLGMVLQAMGDYQGAYTAYKMATQDAMVSGANKSAIAINFNNLASVLQALGDYAEARATYERALQILETELGLQHPDVAMVVNNLGSLLRTTGDYAGAQLAFNRALQVEETVFGPNHPKISKTINNLGYVLKELGDYSGARAAFERALRLNEIALGPNHPDVFTCVNNLGSVLYDTGDYAGARVAFERALLIKEIAFGPTHPNVALGLSNWGLALYAQKDYEGARSAFERALAIDQEFFDPHHPTIAVRLNNLGLALASLNDEDGARVAFERALHIFEAVFGRDHPNTIKARANLAALPTDPS